MEPIFSATPPLETSRILLSVACQEDVFRVEDPFLDLHRRCESSPLLRRCGPRRLRPITRRGPQGKAARCGKLYGSLDAAQRWREHYAQVWETGGFSRGAASPCHLFHKDLETYILVHGDCTEFAARCIRAEQSGNSGPWPSQSRTVSFLGRTLTRATVTVRPRHLVNEQARRQILIRQDFHCGRVTCGDGNETFWKVNGNKKLQHTTKPNKSQDTARSKQTHNFSQLENM